MNTLDRLSYRVLKKTVWFFSRLPLRPALVLGAGLGLLAFRLMGRRRQIAVDNVHQALGAQVTPQEEKRIVRESYKNLGRTLMEFCRIPRLNSNNLTRLVEIEGLEKVVQALAKGRGVVLITAHFGNWELMPPATALRGYPLRVIVRPMDWAPLDMVVSEIRSMHGTKLISKWQGMSDILSTLRQGEAIGILMDQNTVAREGVFVDFLGRPASTTIGVALAAIRTGAPVLPAHIVRLGKGKHRMFIGDEIPVITTGDLHRDIETNTARFSQALESFIRAHPDHWLWLHQRWKTQPSDAARVAAAAPSPFRPAGE
ncbi:MAG: lysophospholipid acyltransferase family protein [Candidatus Tectomicrobia bacterium]|uniref:Lysophospholipid acyltransferase family protein n=1 Tax=Tectimicrobiota bacterium TaxID=2528274 RepID=A0A932GRW3_UNCTE|nr:lysophospholipid acyltransferase family protein [Candidatus Tectomicrobia bacterium]